MNATDEVSYALCRLALWKAGITLTSDCKNAGATVDVAEHIEAARYVLAVYLPSLKEIFFPDVFRTFYLLSFSND